MRSINGTHVQVTLFIGIVYRPVTALDSAMIYNIIGHLGWYPCKVPLGAAGRRWISRGSAASHSSWDITVCRRMLRDPIRSHRGSCGTSWTPLGIHVGNPGVNCGRDHPWDAVRSCATPCDVHTGYRSSRVRIRVGGRVRCRVRG